MDYVAVFLFAFGTNIIFEFFDPVLTFLTVNLLAMSINLGGEETYSAGSNMFLRRTHRDAWLTLIGRDFVSVFGFVILCF